MEESESPTRVPADYNLKNWSTIAYSAALWNQSNVTPFFDTENRTAYIEKMVKEKEKTLKSLPSQILNRILFTFASMGQRIAFWCRFAEKILMIPRDLAATIYWTTDGVIDEVRIHRSSKIKPRNPLLKETRLFYYAVCANVHIDYITHNWKDILSFCSFNEYSCDARKYEKNFEFIVRSVTFLARLTSSQLLESHIERFNDIDDNQVKNMFWLSVEEGCAKAASYYWGLMEEEEKQIQAIRIATDSSFLKYLKNRDHDSFKRQGNSCFKGHIDTECMFIQYKCKSSVDLFIYFIKHMSEGELTRFITEISYSYSRNNVVCGILDIFMYHSPTEEFLPIANEVVLKHCRDANDSKHLLIKILGAMDRNKELGLGNKLKFHGKLFIAAWGKLRTYKTWKEILNGEKHLIKSIDDLFDLDILDFIINTCCEDEYRKRILEIGMGTFKTLVENEEYELLQKFVDDVLKSEDERKWFKTFCFEFSEDFINQFKFDTVNKLFQFTHCGTNQDLVVYTCERFIYNNPTPLKFTFNSEEKNLNFRKNWLVSNPSWVAFLWESKKAQFLDYIPKFLRWILKSEDEANQFEIKKLTAQISLKNLFGILFTRLVDGSQIFYVVDKFLLHCLSDQNVKKLKCEIIKNVSEWISFLYRKCCLHCVDDFLNWILISMDLEKSDVIEAYLIENELEYSETEEENHCDKKTAGTSYDPKNRTRLLECRQDVTEFEELESEIDFFNCEYIYFKKNYMSKYEGLDTSQKPKVKIDFGDILHICD